MKMDEKAYLSALYAIRGSRKNDIIDAVNRKVPKDKAGLKSDVEKMFYDNLWAEAEALQKKYGDWPVFDMYEIESDDPRLDIYNNPV